VSRIARSSQPFSITCFTHHAGVIAAAGRAITRRANHEISAARCECIPAAAKHFRRDVQARAACLPMKRAREFQHGARRDNVVACNTQFGFPACRHALDARFEFPRGAQDVTVFGQQFAPGGAELGAMTAAVEQQHVEIFFELLHGVGHRRRHAMQFVCRCREAAFAVDRIQHQQSVYESGIAFSKARDESGRAINQHRLPLHPLHGAFLFHGMTSREGCRGDQRRE
jgi:hypothetical protein